MQPVAATAIEAWHSVAAWPRPCIYSTECSYTQRSPHGRQHPHTAQHELTVEHHSAGQRMGFVACTNYILAALLHSMRTHSASGIPSAFAFSAQRLRSLWRSLTTIRSDRTRSRSSSLGRTTLFPSSCLGMPLTLLWYATNSEATASTHRSPCSQGVRSTTTGTASHRAHRNLIEGLTPT